MTEEPTAPRERRDRRPRDPQQWFVRPIEKYRKSKLAYAFRPNPEFFALADLVIQADRTLLGYDRLYVLWQVLRNVIDIPGSIAEIGTYRGGSAYFIASACTEIIGEELPFHVFDTFEGHPEAAISERDPHHRAGLFSATSYEDVREYLSRFARLQIHKGDVLNALPDLAESEYRLVHVDTDLYLPTKACLQYFGTRLLSGGVFVLDDYESKKCEGVRTAVGEYLQETDAFQVWDMRTEQLVLVKR